MWKLSWLAVYFVVVFRLKVTEVGSSSSSEEIGKFYHSSKQ